MAWENKHLLRIFVSEINLYGGIQTPILAHSNKVGKFLCSNEKNEIYTILNFSRNKGDKMEKNIVDAG
tara:strand:+ start:961 stop:1164 length:204 start_codon:yes stop_codon:yes gene_type:complete